MMDQIVDRSLQAANYGKCIVADYQSVHQDMCKKEFMALKDCYLVRDPFIFAPNRGTDFWFRKQLKRSDMGNTHARVLDSTPKLSLSIDP